MTRKHFETFARIIGEARALQAKGGDGLEHVQLHLVGYFATQNQNFDGRRFNQAVEAEAQKGVA